LIGVGLWFVLRNFEHIPQLAVERLFGLGLLYFNALVSIHFITMLTSKTDAVSLARASGGGGYLGGFIAGGLFTALGPGGAAVALAAWLVIALALSLDITVVDMFKALSSASERLQDWIIEVRQNRRAADNKHMPEAHTYIEYQPASRRSPSPGAPPTGSLLEQSPPFVPEAVNSVQAKPLPHWELPALEQILDKGSEASYNDERDLQRA